MLGRTSRLPPVRVRSFALELQNDYLDIAQDTIDVLESLLERTHEDELYLQSFRRAPNKTDDALSAILEYASNKIEDGIAAGHYHQSISCLDATDQPPARAPSERRAPTPTHLMDNIRLLENKYGTVIEAVESGMECFTTVEDPVRRNWKYARIEMRGSLAWARKQTLILRRQRRDANTEARILADWNAEHNRGWTAPGPVLVRTRKNEEEHISSEGVHYRPGPRYLPTDAAATDYVETVSETAHGKDVAAALSDTHSEHEATRINSSITGIRQPMNSRYSINRDYHAAWVKMGERSKLKWSHIGRIEETDAGMDAPEPCDFCARSSEFPCRVYKEVAVGVHTTSRSDWQACSHCRAVGNLCSLTPRCQTRRKRIDALTLPIS